MNRQALSRILTWVICLVLSLGVQTGQLTRSLNAALASRAPIGQQQGQSQSNTEEHHDHAAQESLKGIFQRAYFGGLGPTRGWLVLRAALNAHPVTPDPLVAEDVRHILLPRRSPPPEPEQQHV